MLKKPSKSTFIAPPAMVEEARREMLSVTVKNKRSSGTSRKISELISELLRASAQLHRFHLNETSFARHEALGVYTVLPELVDELAENFLSCNVGMIEEFGTHTYHASPEELITCITSKINDLPEVGRGLGKPLDDISATLGSALYKLRRLA